MNDEQIALVQDSFDKVRLIATTAAELFYGRLFDLDPSIRPLFSGDMKEQGRKLMDTIDIVAKGLSVPEVILPTIKQLGKRHVGYGVKDEHYDTVGEALIWTLEQGLGEDFTPDVREAWTEAYNFFADVMKEAAHEDVTDPVIMTMQAQIQAQKAQLQAQQQQIKSTNQLVNEIHQLQLLIQETNMLSRKGSQNGYSWWRRLWRRSPNNRVSAPVERAES